MSFSEFFRKLFGGRSEDHPVGDSFTDTKPNRSTFRDPIWKTNDDDYDDDEIYSDFRNPQIGPHFDIFSDPLKITQYFEAQMDNMLKNFTSQFGIIPFSFHDGNSTGALPFDGFSDPAQREDGSNLREKFLKPGCDDSVEVFDKSKPKVDTDLDGNITPDEFSKLWDNRKGTKEVQPFVPEQRSFGKSVTSQFVRRPDGTMEHKKVFRDSEGNEETVITRQIGNQKYVVTTRRDKNGEETKTEDLINMDEKELQDFNQKWVPASEPQRGRSSILDQFFWDKFFEPNPKL